MPGPEAAAENIQIFKTSEEVSQRIGEMAVEVVGTYAEENPFFVSLMRGALPFTTDLMRAIRREARQQKVNFHPEVDLMTISTYGKGREAQEPHIVMDLAPKAHVSDRTVVLLGDVLDWGHTLEFADRHLRSREPKDVHSIVLVEKENDRTTYHRGADIVGFRSPAGLWLIGMGMDDANQAVEAGRWDDDISIVIPPADQ